MDGKKRITRKTHRPGVNAGIMRLDRLLSIIIMLLNRRRVQAKELADYFGISARTVYRDIDAINQAGIPIVSFQGNQGGLGIVDNYKLDRQVLTLEDMGTILSTLKGINTTFKDKQLDKAIEKIHALVPDEKQRQIEEKLQQVIIDVLPWGFSERKKQNLQIIQNAISCNTLIRFLYRDSKGKKGIRTVEPMTLIFKAYTWYLFAFCQLRKDFRLFRLSRISRIKTSTKKFIRKVVDYKEYEENSQKIQKMVDLVLEFSPYARYQAEDYFEEKQLTIQRDGSVIARMSIPEDDWIYSMLLSYGENMKVISPQRVRKTLQEKAKKIVARYQT